MLILFLLALFILVATTLYDVHQTAEGIAAGNAVEGNKLIVALFGRTPTVLQDYIGAAIIDSFMLAPALIGVFFHNVVFFSLGIGSMLAYSAKHVYAGRAWNAYKK